MKLYATITSERASKGQGGNKFLDIEIKAERLKGIPTRANVYRLHITTDNNQLNAELLDYSNGTTQNLITYRGAPEAQDRHTINFYCARCDIEENWAAEEITKKGTPVCPKCYENMLWRADIIKQKGKKQKGEECPHNNKEWRDENGKSYLNCFNCGEVLRIK